MKITNLNDLEQSVLNAVQKKHLTSYETLQRVEDVSMLLSLHKTENLYIIIFCMFLYNCSIIYIMLNRIF